MDCGRASLLLGRSEAERRRVRCELFYNMEVELLKVGWGDSALVHDDERGVFRVRDGRFAFSREHADRALPRMRGRIKSR